MTISVIIPVYNVEAYLGECLDSLIAQTHESWEGIIVDDASADGSLRVAEGYARCDSRLRVYHNASNLGPSAARNAGLDMAQGEYIVFLDSDDVLHPRFLEWMAGGLEDHAADISSCAFKTFGRLSDINYRRKAPEFCISGAEEAIRRILFQKGGDHCSVDAKIYRREMWEGVRFRPGVIYEDLDVFYRVYERAHAIAYTATPLYYYRRNPASITHVFTPRRADVLDVTSRIEAWATTRRPALLAAARSRSLSAAFNILMLMKRNGFRDPELSARCRTIIRDRRRECLTGSDVRLRNRLASLASYAWPGF